MDCLDRQDIAAQGGRGERQEPAGVEKSLGDCEKISQLYGKTAHSTHSLQHTKTGVITCTEPVFRQLNQYINTAALIFTPS